MIEPRLVREGQVKGASAELARLRRAWERDETRLQERMAAISARLAGLQSGNGPEA